MERIQDEVDYAKKKGVLLVVPAGNHSVDIDSQPSYPASFSESNIIAVAATTAANQLASFSDVEQEEVDLGAAGRQHPLDLSRLDLQDLSGTQRTAQRWRRACCRQMSSRPE